MDADKPNDPGTSRRGMTRRERVGVWAAAGAQIGMLCGGAAIVTLTYLDLLPAKPSEGTVNSAILYGSMAAGAIAGAVLSFRRIP